ncbi:hypothetical protein B5807_05164 [Epicoccum nigrum]|uniref:Glycine zipper 2TM domain-containing protein n=1 Tax=Epicoccum nigrum TaxID=105696 RepID=A0A1Y2M338_EPING|nr:hypothetical protein B5807_05164 [Epicoccum nigrum]
MSVLAFKALGHGAEKIPDKFFEKIPGGFFKPEEEKKKGKKNRSSPEDKRRRSSDRSRRERSPQNDYSDYSSHDSDFDEEAQKGERRRRKTTRRGTSRSPSRGRGGEYNDRDMAYLAEQGQGQVPYFPPPPTSEYATYSPQEYDSRPSQGDYRPTSAQPQPLYGQTYPTQPPINRHDGISPPVVAYGEEAAHRYEEIQHAKTDQTHQPQSASATRYTPGPGYAPSPVSMPTAPIPPPPVGVNFQPTGANAPYAPYNPATFGPNDHNYPPLNGYASPSPINRQQSRSQPSFEQDQRYYSYNPRSSDQRITAYNDHHSPGRRSSTKHDRREHRHRARSVDSRSSRREKSRMSDMREKFDDMDLRTKNLGATVAGALAGGFAGRAAGKSRLTMLAGAAAGALGGQAIATRNVERVKEEHGGHLPSRSRSRSRRRKHDDRDRSRDRKNVGGLRARSRSIIDRFRSKSQRRDGRDDRDGRDRHYDSDSQYESDDRHRRRDGSRDSRRPDRGYKVHEEYDYFLASGSDGDDSPVVERRKKTVKKKD